MSLPARTLPECRWPHCVDFDDRCATGVNIPCAPAIIIHPPFDGERLARAKNPPRVPLAGKILLASLAIVAMCTVSSMIIRHLATAEAAYQIAARV